MCDVFVYLIIIVCMYALLLIVYCIAVASDVVVHSYIYYIVVISHLMLCVCIYTICDCTVSQSVVSQ